MPMSRPSNNNDDSDDDNDDEDDNDNDDNDSDDDNDDEEAQAVQRGLHGGRRQGAPCAEQTRQGTASDGQGGLIKLSPNMWLSDYFVLDILGVKYNIVPKHFCKWFLC